MKTAILVDGGFFLRRYRRLYDNNDPRAAAQTMHVLCLKHLSDPKIERTNELYRILYYDCPPLAKKVHLPISGRSLDFSKTQAFEFRTKFHKDLKRLRQVALRRGQLRDGNGWIIRPDVMEQLVKNEIQLEDLSDEHFTYDVQQKGVDMKIGLDIASLAYKRLVGQIVLIAGDSDFVPAAKLARREGIEVVLDSMWQPVSDDLREHIDGLRSTCRRPETKGQKKGSKVLQSG
jgi:uncharacterized LabA/DUF88 family protein